MNTLKFLSPIEEIILVVNKKFNSTPKHGEREFFELSEQLNEQTEKLIQNFDRGFERMRATELSRSNWPKVEIRGVT